MSGFWGELSLSGARVDPEHSDAMDSAMSYWLPDAANRWSEGPIALGARLLGVTSWDAFDSLPRVESDLVLVGHVRLDDRETLARDLGREPSTLASTPDSTLVIEAWRKWGESCAQHLYGDWVCAIWNRERRTLWLGRDAAGNTGLYYWHDAGRLVFSTSVKAVLAHPAVPRRPYAYQIARQLAVVSDPAESGSTAWENVRRLPGGHAIRCDLTTVEPYEWWHPESLSEINLQTDDEYYQAFREIYANAVADRLNTDRGPIALMLSGGLDSSSVAALAAPRLLTRGERLIAYTSVPRFSPDGADATRLGDEEALARATANHVGNIEFLPVASVDAGIVASIEEMLRIHDQPQHAASNQYWILEILKLAKNRGARVLLTGQGGNATVSWTGYGNLWPSVLRGELSALISAFTKSEVGAWTTLKRQLLKPVLSPPRDAWRRLRTRGTSPWASYSAINPRFAKQIDLYGRLRTAGQEPLGTDYSPRHPRVATFRLGRLASAHVGATWMEYGAAYHMEVRDPTRDRRLIEFCWRLPDRVFWANGLRRGLIMKGMRGLLPDDVMHSRLKGLQAADLGHRVLADRKAVVEAIERIEAHPLARAWLDVARMRSVLDSLQQPITPESTMEASAILLRGLGAGLFLTRF